MSKYLINQYFQSPNHDFVLLLFLNIKNIVVCSKLRTVTSISTIVVVLIICYFFLLISVPDKLSQEPTPSKWSCLLPDYYSSQADGAVCDVLWDCASPDAIKHLRSEYT